MVVMVEGDCCLVLAMINIFSASLNSKEGHSPVTVVISHTD